MSDDLLSVEEMAEIPKDLASAQGKAGCSKGVNLFLARQKLIADMMEQEDSETPSGAGSSTHTPAAPDSQGFKPPPSSVNPSFVMISAEDQKKRSVEAISEIPDTSATESGSSKSKGVNLFLARQKLIADMMEAEEEEARVAEEAKLRQAEEERRQAEQKRKEEEERARLEELKRIEKEKLLESEKKKAARAAKFRSSKPLPVEDKANRVTFSTDIEDSQWKNDDSSALRISESPPTNNDREVQEQTNPQLLEVDEEIDVADLPPLTLPKPQLPAVTLLQKSRAGAQRGRSFLCDSLSSLTDMHKIRECLAAPALYSGEFAGEIPKGALYVGTSERIEGGRIHTDPFFLVSVLNSTSGGEQQHTDIDSTDSRDESQHPPEHGALSSPVLHNEEADANNNTKNGEKKVSQSTRERSHLKDKPVVKKKPIKSAKSLDNPPKAAMVATASNQTSTTRETVKCLSVDTDGGYDNPFISTASQATSRSCSITSSTSLPSPSIQYREIQKGGDIPFTGLRKPAPVTPPPRAVDDPTGPSSPLITSPPVPVTPEAPSNAHQPTRGRRVYRSEYTAQNLSRSLSRGRQKSEKNRNASPRRPPNLYIVRQNGQHTQPRPLSLQMEPLSPALVRRRHVSEQATGRATSPNPSLSSNNSRPSLIIVPPKASLSNDRSTIQAGTVRRKPRAMSAVEELNICIPCAGQVKVTELPKKVPEPVAGYDRFPAPLPRDQRDKSDARRRELLTKAEQDKKQKKMKEEEAERRARRHSDYFTLKEKSPIPHDRYDRCFFTSKSAPHSPARSTTSQNSPRAYEPRKPFTAVALFHFNAQHPRELSVQKKDTVTILRRVDGNWYEAKKDGRTGIIPVTYVQILREASLSPSPPARPSPPVLKEGTAVAKFNFNPETEAELPLRKGNQVSLIRRVDSNWYEGRFQGSLTTGLFPVSYVQVISEPEAGPMVNESSKQPPSAVNRSQSVPNGSSVASPRLYSSVNERTPSSGYGSTDVLLSHDSRLLDTCHNNNNNADFSIEKSGADEIDEQKKPCRGLEMPSYKSLYSYDPCNDDELQLKPGDIVHVIEKCADGWFVGTSGRTGLFGTFPGNYVTPV